MPMNLSYNELYARAMTIFPYKDKNGKATPNAQQVQIIRSVLSLSTPGGMIIDASTGSGKTAASLTSLIAKADFRKEKIIVFVRTITQMDPIIREWSRIVGGYDGLKNNDTLPLILPLKGKLKLCKLKDTLSKYGNIKPETMGLLCKTIPCKMWPKHPEYNPKKRPKRIIMQSVNLKLAGVVDYGRRSPIDSLDEVYKKIPGQCGYYVQNELLKSARIIVVTYAHMNDSHFMRLLRQAGTELHKIYILVDEAHNLSKRSEMIVTAEDIKKVATMIGKTSLIKKMLKIVNLSGKYDVDEFASFYEWENTARLLSNPADENLAMLGLSKWDLMIPEVINLQSLITSRNQGVLLGGGNMLRLVEATPAKKLAKFAESLIILFQSGTIDPVDEYKALFGLPQLNSLITSNPYKNNKFKCYLKIKGLTSKHSRRSPALFYSMAETIVDIAEFSPRHVLVICPSYSFQEDLIPYLLEHNPVIETRKSSMRELSDAIRLSKEQKLILGVAGGKISEGVELVKNGKSLISLVIMAGLSFRPVSKDNVILKKEIANATLKTSSAENFEQIIPILQDIEQSFGRSIRTGLDRGILVILDYRAKLLAKKIDLVMLNNITTLKNKMTSFFAGYERIESI